MKIGTYKRTKEIREKQRLAMIGKGFGKKRPDQSIIMQGKNNPMWGKKRSLESRQKQSISRLSKTGGISYNSNGYKLINTPNHPFAQAKRSSVLEHRLIIEKQIGRFLKPKEICHHINKIKDDNRPENLMAFKNHSIHRRFEEGKSIKPENIIFDGRNY